MSLFAFYGAIRFRFGTSHFGALRSEMLCVNILCERGVNVFSAHNIEIIRRQSAEALKRRSIYLRQDFIISSLSPPLAALLIMDQNTRHALGTRERKHLSVPASCIYTPELPLCFCSQDAERLRERDSIFISSGGAFKGSEREIKQHIIHPARLLLARANRNKHPLTHK